MDLFDGLKNYMANAGDWDFTLKLEQRAENAIVLLNQYRDMNPPGSILQVMRQLLIDIEKWKAMCIKDQMGMAATNSENDIWRAFQNALQHSTNDRQAILSIMDLRGFGSTLDPESGLRRAKRATAVLRFLFPKTWGVVDWRTVAMLGALEKTAFDVDRAIKEAKQDSAAQLRKDLDLINEDWACEINQKYRDMTNDELPRAADIDMALSGLSLIAWPMNR